MLRASLILAGLLFTAPAAAQFATNQPAWLLADEDETTARSGLIVQPLNANGLHTSRPGMLVHGFRVAPEAGAFMGYRRGNWLFGSTIAHTEEALQDAASLDLSAAYGIDLSAKQRISLEGGIRLDLSSGLGLRSPASLAPSTNDNGLGLRMSWRYSFDRNRYVSTMLGYEQSLGDSFDGGNGERNGAIFGTTFGYRY